MNSETVSRRERILGGLWGSLVGDALGVPVEFKDRATVQANPVTDMRGYGTHHQPPGTWSDDSSLLLCSVESLVLHPEFNPEDMGRRFVRWHREELWTPHGHVFDIGGTTAQALARIAQGMRAVVAGSDTELSNGNGSLMRIIPIALRFADLPIEKLLDFIHQASAITHRHPRSQIACGFFALLTRELLTGASASTAMDRAIQSFRAFYERDVYWSAELDHFDLVLKSDLGQNSQSEISSSGYVIHTLEASIWCLLTTTSFSECVLKAVNLGADTDTTGCVAGGLAGVLYGARAIPEEWSNTLARREEVEHLFERFVNPQARA